MDSLVDSLLLGLLWWDSSWLFSLAIEHTEVLANYEDLAFNTWGSARTEAYLLRSEILETADQASVMENNLINKVGLITEEETKEVVRLTAKVQALEAELVEKQNEIKQTELTRLSKYVVYPTAAIIGLKVTWTLASWLLPKVLPMLA